MSVLRRVRDELFFARVCARAGLLTFDSPRATGAILKAMRDYGQFGAAPARAALKYGDRTAVIDERRSLTFAELDERVNAVANSLRGRGIGQGDGVAILMRNHAGFVETLFACAKLGARIILLNTDFAGPQISQVAEREGARLLICDSEYVELLSGWNPELGRVLGWIDDGDDAGVDPRDTLSGLAGAGDSAPPPPPGEHASVVVLTSGTTGSPKGAPRQEPKSLLGPGSILSKAPFESGQTTVIATPLFHSLGLVHGILGIGLGATIVLRRRFDPAATLDDVERHHATGLIVVPVMLRRTLDLGADAIKARDLRALKIVFVSGSQLGGELCRRALDAFGPVIYNLYGSTEVAYATIATPGDLMAAPDCVGRPPRGTVVRIVDDQRKEVPAGTTGRIFVGNVMTFDGYTSGENKEVLPDGLVASGDVGHVDEAGRLFIDGRDDDMIVSGGENVFPQEVEELLDTHPAVRDAAVIGVDDEKFGARLAAFVVLADGEALDSDGVRDFVRQNLARYKVPRDVEFLDELPRNPTGKVLKRELRERVTSS